MYAYIMSKLSKESKDEVKRHENYDSFSVTNDPLELWITIKELHSVATGSKVKGVIKCKAWEEYALCKQGAFEDIRDYKEQFDNKYESYVAHGNPEKTEEDRAIDFLEGLDKSKYGEFVVEIINDIAKGSMKPPKNVNEVFILANSRLVVRKSGGLNVGASYTTIEAANRGKQNRNELRNRNSRNRNEGKSKKGRGKNRDEEIEEKTGGKNTGNDEGKSTSENERKKKTFRKIVCYNCGEEGHMAHDCDKFDDDDVDEKPLAGMTLTRNNEVGTDGVVVPKLLCASKIFS